jgi:hypothetical protein
MVVVVVASYYGLGYAAPSPSIIAGTTFFLWTRDHMNECFLLTQKLVYVNYLL